MNGTELFPIGKIVNNEECVCIELAPAYAPGLKGLSDFSHVQVLWWANEAPRDVLTEHKPYVHGPETLGVFATRSPERPNLIAVTNADIAYVDEAKGIVGLYYFDAFDGTPVLDLKPYTPSVDRIEHPRVPGWCAHWPKCYEESGEFDWAAEFNF